MGGKESSSLAYFCLLYLPHGFVCTSNLITLNRTSAVLLLLFLCCPLSPPPTTSNTFPFLASSYFSSPSSFSSRSSLPSATSFNLPRPTNEVATDLRLAQVWFVYLKWFPSANASSFFLSLTCSISFFASSLSLHLIPKALFVALTRVAVHKSQVYWHFLSLCDFVYDFKYSLEIGEFELP